MKARDLVNKLQMNHLPDDEVGAIFSRIEIRDAAYEVLSRLPESEYEYAEKLLWAFNSELEREGK